jgi:small subunit ribosomal protein S16
MLVIRFLRVGKRNQPAFKIVVCEKKTAPKSGKFIEQVGFYNPLTRERILKRERIKYWLSVGAKPSPRVHNLLIEEKILEGKKIPVHKKPKEKKTEKEPARESKEKTEEKPQTQESEA